MADYVFDASALLAIAFNEPGADRAIARMAGASISAVNYSEAGAKLIDKGFDPVEAFTWLDALRLHVIDFDTDCARQAAALRTGTRERRLSFADRACLAQAMKEDAVALTTDRVWAELDLACGVELLR